MLQLLFNFVRAAVWLSLINPAGTNNANELKKINDDISVEKGLAIKRKNKLLVV